MTRGSGPAGLYPSPHPQGNAGLGDGAETQGETPCTCERTCAHVSVRLVSGYCTALRNGLSGISPGAPEAQRCR